MQLLRWRQVEVINDIGDVGHAILPSIAWVLEDDALRVALLLLLEAILNYVPLLVIMGVSGALVSLVASIMHGFFVLAKVAIVVSLVPQIDLFSLDILSCQMLVIVILDMVCCEPWVDQRLLDVN